MLRIPPSALLVAKGPSNRERRKLSESVTTSVNLGDHFWTPPLVSTLIIFRVFSFLFLKLLL